MKIKSYQTISIDLIKRDPKQPRTFFSPTQVSEMAKSIISTGVINAIEVDENYVIITGEMRYRASKEAGLKEVPVKIVQLDEKERFLRQFVENSSHNTMTTLDTAQAVKKLLAETPGNDLTEKISVLSEKTGKARHFFKMMLDFLEEPEEIKEAVDVKGRGYSTFLEISKRAPEHLKEALRDKVLSGEIKKREHVREFLRGANEDTSLKEMEYYTVSQDVGLSLVKKIKHLTSVLETKNLQKLDPTSLAIVSLNLGILLKKINSLGTSKVISLEK